MRKGLKVGIWKERGGLFGMRDLPLGRPFCVGSTASSWMTVHVEHWSETFFNSQCVRTWGQCCGLNIVCEGACCRQALALSSKHHLLAQQMILRTQAAPCGECIGVHGPLQHSAPPPPRFHLKLVQNDMVRRKFGHPLLVGRKIAVLGTFPGFFCSKLAILVLFYPKKHFRRPFRKLVQESRGMKTTCERRKIEV